MYTFSHHTQMCALQKQSAVFSLLPVFEFRNRSKEYVILLLVDKHFSRCYDYSSILKERSELHAVYRMFCESRKVCSLCICPIILGIGA